MPNPECKNGHERTAENTRTRTRLTGPRAGQSHTYCLDCRNESQKRYQKSGRGAEVARRSRQSVDRAAEQPLCACGGGKRTNASTRTSPGATGYCTDCKRAQAQRWRANRAEVYRASQKRRREELFDGFLAAYGGRCNCCGESERRFLSLDHTNNDGGGRDRHRKGQSTSTILRSLRRRGWPRDPAYRLLCFNCNTGRHLNGGICPHEEIA